MACRVIRASAADVRRVWADTELTLPQAARALDMSEDALRDRAVALGLSKRKAGQREVIRPHREAEFRLMWRAGVSARQIGLAFGCSYFGVVNTAKRLGLAMRGANYVPKMTLTQYHETRLRLRIAADIAAGRDAGSAGRK